MTSIRSVSNQGSLPTNQPDILITARAELDSHADTVCCGSSMRIIERTDQVVDVRGFHDDLNKMTNIPIVQAGTAYDHPTEGTLILIFNQSLAFCDGVKDSLINPNQLRDNGLIVKDVPKHLSHDGSSRHAIIVPDLDLELPLKLNGVISYLDTRLPTMEEIHSCTWIDMTFAAVWSPYANSFEEDEERISEK